jgi:energy-coupling factor transport system ATP-binding protein
VITFEHATLTYAGAEAPTVRDVDLTIDEGELCLVVGPSGSGKSTLLRMINGLVPHFSGGLLEGRVVVDGRDTQHHPPRELADVVGFVGQDPMAGFVTDVVEDELAYGMETLGLDPAVMRRRVEEVLDQLALAPLRKRALRTLSGGERQRVAIGAALTPHPRALVLDEPTSALDPGAAEEVLAHLQRLVHDLGMTVVLAEHRLERVVQYADRVIVLAAAGGRPTIDTPADAMQTAAIAPPVVQIGRAAGWSPLPLSVRDARRAAAPLRDRGAPSSPHVDHRSGTTNGVPTRAADDALVSVTALRTGYGRHEVLHGVDLTVAPGELIALMGRNGSGKSTLLSALVGLRPAAHGTVRLVGADPASLAAPELVARVGLVPQQAGDLLYTDSVAAECRAADRDSGLAAGTTRRLLTTLAPTIDDDAHPGDLSEGQRLSLALAVVMAPEPALLLLDEPTRGLDYGAKERLVAILREARTRGHAVIVATHDVELAAELATRTIVMAEGGIVADGPTREVATASPMFAPQATKIFAPLPVLTVGDAERLIGEVPR